MLCPYCQTENRDDREACYYCKKDLSMLRLIVNKASTTTIKGWSSPNAAALTMPSWK